MASNKTEAVSVCKRMKNIEAPSHSGEKEDQKNFWKENRLEKSGLSVKESLLVLHDSSVPLVLKII